VLEIAARHKLWVLEDCAQAQGAKYKGKTVGSMGHAGAYSFYPSKNLTVLGDGGCICTNDAALAEKLRMLRNHGRKDKYLHEIAGFNVRFNEIQGAVGRVGLKNLDRLNARRREIAAVYNRGLAGLALTPPEKPWANAVYHMYVIQVDRRDELARFLKERGIETGVHYPVPNHQQPAVTSRFQNIPLLPVTEAVVPRILSLPIHGEMEIADAEAVCAAIGEFFGPGVASALS
jgi:dTDP-4-amino-4,6-dideoxygalactose transaminase